MQRGFTLIELLVVIFIIGVVVSAMTIALGDNQAERMQQKSEQLAALIDLAKEQAIFNSEELGIAFSKDTYSFYRLNTDVADEVDAENPEEEVWEKINDDPLLTNRTLPDGLEFELFLEGIKVDYANNEKITPQIYILSDGAITPFRIAITDKIDHTHSLKVAENGVFEFAAIN